MAEYNFEQLYAWLQEEERSLNWGMISFMDREKLNRLLLQVYIRRFKTDSYLKPLTGSIENGADRRFALNQFTLDWPRLGFLGGHANDSTARLTTQIMSGTQLGLRNAAGEWEVREIRETSPLLGPELNLKLLLANVPGVVGEEGRVRLDLKESSDFSINVSDDPGEQRLVGEWFKQMFDGLEAPERVFTLGQIEAGGDPLLRAKSFALRTQARMRDADDDEGAVLAMVRFEGDEEGHIPGNDFRYLLPSDRPYDATVLFGPTRIMLAQLVQSLKTIVSNVEFDLRHDEEGRLIGAVAKNGEMIIEEQILTHTFESEPIQGIPLLVLFEAEVPKIVLKLEKEFGVSINGNKVEIKWKIEGVLGLKPVYFNDQLGFIGRMLVSGFFDPSEFFSYTEDDFSYTFTSTYELEDVDGGSLKFVSLEVVEHKAAAPVLGEIKVKEPPPVGSEEAYFLALLSMMLAPIITVMWALFHNFFKGIDVEVPSVEGILREAFEKNFKFTSNLRELVDQTIKLNFGNALIGQDQFAPRDIAFFGAVNPTVTAFAIDPMQHTLVAGSAPLQFNTVPAHPDLIRWTCEPVLDSVSNGQIGSIDEHTGLYTPPAASDFDGDFVRLRVNARHIDTDFSSSALMTVLRSGLHISPLLYVTQVNSTPPTVNLRAGYLGDVTNLKWESPQYGQLTADGKTAVYTPPAVMPPLDDYPDKPASFALDKITLSDSTDGGGARVALVITEGNESLPMRITREVDVAAGTVQLKAKVGSAELTPDKVQWKVVYGSGAIDPNTFIYTHDASSSDPFAVITATHNAGDYGVAHQYVVQTLPPARLEEAVRGVGAFQLPKV
ncbi:hypothetical protein [Pseudomonas putida]|uniref:hypothetical protein n=1 Tax=Pseudomonas putida TaxID=303 RepID=UPI0039068F9F